METTLPISTLAEKNSANRILIIDILRGFALFGIIINHISYSYLAGPPPSGASFNVFSPLDEIINTACMYLTSGKFFTIFSFLFGLSFAIQTDSAGQKGAAFSLTFLWRLLILFAIGFVHNMFYSGDILVIYAVLGLLLLPARFLPGNILIPIALLLVLNTPNLVQEIVGLSAPAPTEAQIAAQRQGYEGFVKMANEQYRIKQSGTVAEVIRMNAIGGLIGKLNFQLMTGRLWITLGLFLLGVCAGRKKIFEYIPGNVAFFKRLLLFSGVIALISTTLAALYGNPFGGASSFIGVIGNFAFSVHQISLSAFYVAGVVLLYWQTKAGKRLNLLAAVGQMGLTTYLLQSVFGLSIYFGFGLGMMGYLGVTTSVALGISFFILQIFFANYWMSRYRYGMVEWLWRSLTYMKPQTMRKNAQRPVAAV